MIRMLKLKSKLLMILVVLGISLVGCSKDTLEISEVQVALNNVEMLMNIRYNGYDGSIDSNIREACSESVAGSIISTLSDVYGDKGLVDITDFVMEQTNTDGLGISDCIIDDGGKYYIDTTKVEFNYPDLDSAEIQVYDGVYELKKEDIESSLWECKGNKNYKLDVLSYEVYDDGYMEVELGSSKEENVVSNEQKVGLMIGLDGKIESIDVSDIISKLQYD